MIRAKSFKVKYIQTEMVKLYKTDDTFLKLRKIFENDKFFN